MKKNLTDRKILKMIFLKYRDYCTKIRLWKKVKVYEHFSNLEKVEENT